MKRRITHIIWGLPHGGAERQVVTLASGLNGDDFEIQVACLTEGGPLADELRGKGIPVHLIGKKKGVDVGATFKLSALLKSFQTDLVHTHIFTANLWGRIAAMLSGTPARVTHEHSTFTLDSKQRLFLDKRLLGRTDKIIAVSNDIRERFLREGGYPEDKIVTIHNGIDFAPLEAEFDRAALRREIGAEANDRLIGIVGMLEPRKDHASFLRAAKLILEKIPQARFVIPGSGPLEDELKRLSEELQISARVNFLGWRDDTPRLVRLLDVYVSSSNTEGISIALLEAMYAGVPAVVTPVGGNREVISDGQNGVFADAVDFPQRKAQVLADKITWILENSESAAQLGAKARETVRREFGAGTMLEKVGQLYGEILRRKSPRASGV